METQFIAWLGAVLLVGAYLGALSEKYALARYIIGTLVCLGLLGGYFKWS